MEQNKIWEHFQNEDLEAFKGNAPRLNFILGKIERLTRAPGMNVLDIGVGNGYFEMLAVQKKYSVAALDPDNKAIEKLKRMGIDAKQGSLSAVPFADNTFDFVVASEVLEHLKSEEMPKAIQEINRVLKKGGYFVGTVPFNELLKDKMTVCPFSLS
jgi:ubiquinone/menaquinone biosynthesis C-methylase UbiE